jgi:hypothetical protein
MTKSRFAVGCSPGGDVFPSRSFLSAVPGLGGEGEPDAATPGPIRRSVIRAGS